MILSVKAGKLTIPAALTGGFTGFAVYAGGGLIGFLSLVAFFVLGVLATAHKKSIKASIRAAGPHSEKRNAGQVLANGGVAALCGILAVMDEANEQLYVLMLAASLASATADTLSSELGMVYGRKFYNVLSFRKDRQGMDGVVSIEGTLLGIAGAAIIAAIYSLFVGFGNHFWLIVLAGTVGNLADSVLGAALERRRFIGNDFVNFLNTLAAALVALLLY
ncbi:MAG: DUF92 domain-containing protein [Niastella sp.]|nr:DUF92 domain-containing protein [Niastella sp.]